MADKQARRGVTVYIDGSEVKNSVQSISTEMNKLIRDQKKMTIGSAEYIAQGKKIGQLKGVLNDHIAQQRKIAAEYEKSNKSVSGFFNKITGGFGKMFAGLAVGAAVFGALRSWGQQVLEFSKAVSQLSAITGATGEDLDYLKNKAKELGAEYGKSATEIVEAMKLVGSAKPELLENAAALSDMTESVLILAKASGMELSDTTQNLATIMNQFGLSAAESNRVINTLAAGSKYGAVEVDYLGDAIGKVGAVAASAGIDLETTVAVMELFGEKGIKAEIAGTGFKSLLVELQKDTKNYTNGVFDLNKAIDNNQSIAGDNIKLTEKFGKEYFNLAQILFQGKERFIELNDQVTGTNTAFEQYAVATDNLSGDIEKLTGSWSAFILALEDGQGPIANTFRKLVQLVNTAVDGMKVLAKSNGQKETDLIAQNVNSRIENYKKNSVGVKDPLKDINAEIIAEKKLYAAKKERIKTLKLELEENDKKNFFMHSTQLEHDNKILIENLEKEVTRSVGYVNALGALRSEMNVKPTENPTDPNKPTEEETKKDTAKAIDPKKKLKDENLKLSNELADAAIADLQDVFEYSELVNREQLAGKKQTLEEEYAAKIAQLAKEKQLELDKADISNKSAEDIAKEKLLIEQKYRTLNAEEQAKFDEQTAAESKNRELKYLNDKLTTEADNLQSKFDIEKQLRELAMIDELALVEKGSKEEKAIRDKYRKMELDAEANKTYQKQQLILQYAQAGMGIANGLNQFLTQLDNAELANFEKNNKGKANFDEEYAKKKAKMEYDAAVRAKITGALSTIISTSAAIIGALAPPPIGLGAVAGIPFSIAAGAEGALQLAAVLAAPLPQMWTGGFTGSGGKYEPKGIVHGNEFVANSEALQNPNLMPMFRAIDAAQRMGTVRSLKPRDLTRALRQDSYDQGGAVRQMPAGNQAKQSEVYVAGSIAKMEKTIDRLSSILDNGIEARSVISGNTGSYEQTKKYEKLIKNAKR